MTTAAVAHTQTSNLCWNKNKSPSCVLPVAVVAALFFVLLILASWCMCVHARVLVQQHAEHLSRAHIEG